MINRRVLEDLLQQPLGPYYDRDVLHETACQMQGVTKPVLYSFVLERDGHVTGYNHDPLADPLSRSNDLSSLDESEQPLDGQDNRVFRFRGVLKIADPGWLSDFGLKTVEAELNLRATERALREGERRPPQLTLEDLFGNGFLTASSDSTWRKEDDPKLTVQIQGEKNMPAIFMHSSKVPNGMLWSSKSHNRNYEIATMDTQTYSQSEIFFWRWRLLALMKKIVDLFPYISPQKRTPIWFVERYMDRFASPPQDKHRRLLFDENDTDIEESGKTVTPRRLLRPHTSEILGLLAAQVEWFITNNEVRKKKLFDVTSWGVFARNVREARKEAARQKVTWGIGMGAQEGSDESESDEDELGRLVRKNPVIGKSYKTVARKIELAQARLNHKAKTDMSSSGSGSEADVPGRAEYVSDFSMSSDEEENGSDHRLEEEAVRRIPWQLQLPPLLPDVDGRWWCPLRECNYQIDLHNLTEEERRVPDQNLVQYILKKQWRNAAYDDKVLQGFRYLVTNHYMKHFAERGVKMEKREGRVRFMCINGRQRRHGANEPIKGPMPARGTLGGESRVVPVVHAPQVGHFHGYIE